MASFESPSFNFESNYEKSLEAIDDDIDLRSENEVFRDNERLSVQEDDQSVLAEKDNLADEKDGVLYVAIPSYKYDTAYNPFLGMGPRTIRLYSVARHLDVMFLHRFMYGNILVRGLRSGDYVPKYKRAKFIENIKQTGGLPISESGSKGYDFKALRFAPYVSSDSTMPVFEDYHKGKRHAGDRPHFPVDIWLVYDINAYEQVSEEPKGKIAAYSLKDDYDRQSSLLAIAAIN